MYIENFENSDDVINSFQAPEDALNDATVFLAWYGYGDYCGRALVVFEQNGKLYEVNGSHCSCNGLEGQWEPEETSWEALDKRNFSNEYDAGQEATEDLQKIVTQHLKGEQ